MILHKKFFFLLIFFLNTKFLIGQNLQLSTYAEISVVTYGPGEALFEKFGHTAIRIKDPLLRLDLVYNYGIFDTSEANFYVNFTKGFMKYKLVRYPFINSVESYQKDKRWVKQQVLNLSVKEKNKIFGFLEQNAQPKNASYYYDPFFDNCSTKPNNILFSALGDTLIFDDNFIVEKKTMRQLMNSELHWNTWGSLGINIALGNRLDRIATPQEYAFLPDYVFKILAESKVKRNEKLEDLVLKTETILDFEEKIPTSDNISPFLVFLLVTIIGLFLTMKDYKNASRTRWFDFFLLSITGIFGILIIFLWFFTNHSTAPNNFNFLWAFAPNFIVVFFLLKIRVPKWVSVYYKILVVMLCILPILWITGFQTFPLSLLSFYLLLLVRYVYVIKFIKNSE